MIPHVGLTGGIASGKSTVAKFFSKFKVPVVDADEVTHSLYGPNTRAARQIGREFGAEFIDERGAVDRDLLRQAVFSDERVRRRLEGITHPLIERECLHQMRAVTGTYGLLVAPLLLERDFLTDQLQRILVIDCDEETQVAHGLDRGRFTVAQVKAAMKAQLPRAARRDRADDIIVNDGDLDTLAAAVKERHHAYLRQYATGDGA